MEVDMELLRLIGTVRSALPGLLEGDGDGEAFQAAREIVARATSGVPTVAAAMAEVTGRLSSGPPPEAPGEVPAVVDTLLEAMEGVAFDPSDSGSSEALAHALQGWRSLYQPEGKPPPSDSLHDVAAYLVQMDPEVLESLEVLRDGLSQLLDQWSGSHAIRARLQDRLDELQAVVGNRRSRKSRRVEAVDRLGEVLEEAMQEEEEAMKGEGALPPEGAMQEAGAVQGAFATPAETDSSEEEERPAAAFPVQAPGGMDGSSPASPDIAVDADPELVLDFVAEGLDYLDQAEEALLLLESDPTDAESVNVTFRAFHTIKGVSAFLDLTQVAHVAHEAETLLAQVREGSIPFTASAADLFLRSADVLRSLLVGIREVVNGGTAGIPHGLEPLVALLGDPGLAARLAGNAPLGPQDATGQVTEDGRAGAPVSRDPAPGELPLGDLVSVEPASDEPTVGLPSGERTLQGVQLEAGAAGTGSGDDSVRIRTERLDRLVDLVGELVVSHSMISQDPEVLVTRGDLGKKVSHSQKILRELQDLSTSLRMVPLKPAFHKISRVVRDVSRRSGKRVELIAQGEETELDRSMVGVITDPLVHMVRNSIDHGIESAEERRAAGKPEHGTLQLTARQAGGNVVVELRDDGRGLDRDRILAKAVQRGLVDPERTLSDDEIHALIFQAGFSTAEAVTDLSGRGVGMDVVRRAVESLRGRIEIHSEPRVGTRFSIHLPLTLAITDGMLVQVGGERYIIPTMKIQLSFRPAVEDLWSVSDRGEMVMLQEQLIPIVRLHKLFQLAGGREDPTGAILVVVGEGTRRTAVLVDELLGQQQFVVKALTGAVAGTPGVTGGAILGDGGVGLILDPDEIIELARHPGGTQGGSRQAVA